MVRAEWPEAGWPEKGCPEARVARGCVARGPQCGKRETRKLRERALCSEDFYSWWGRSEEVSYWLTGEGGASFPRGTWLRGYVWGSISLNPYLAPDSICSFCIQDRGQVINQSCFTGFFFGHCRPPPLPLPSLGWIHNLKVFLFPASGDDTHRLSRAPPLTPHYHSFACVVRNAWRSYRTRLKSTESTGETCLPPSPCLGLLFILPKSQKVLPGNQDPSCWLKAAAQSQSFLSPASK